MITGMIATFLIKSVLKVIDRKLDIETDHTFFTQSEDCSDLFILK
jgi:hypothetical protein